MQWLALLRTEVWARSMCSQRDAGGSRRRCRSKRACALCHGGAILRYAKLSTGEYLAKGKTVTGFANVEEDFADQAATRRR
jgi:hypothetical protein